MGDYDAATEYYDEFVEIAPHDDMKYVLRYAIKKGQGASFDELSLFLKNTRMKNTLRSGHMSLHIYTTRPEKPISV